MDKADKASTRLQGGGMRQKLSILQWNCRTITNKVPYLVDYLRNRRQDVLMLQSLNVGMKSLPHLDGYFYPPEVGLENGRVMVATYISTRLKYFPQESPVPTVDCRLATCAVSIPSQGGRRYGVNLVNVYYPNGSKSEAEVTWLRQLNSEQSNWVVAGDFNVSHGLWDPGARSGGLHLANTILDSNLALLNDGSVTRIGVTGQRNSAIDLSLATPDVSLDAHWETGEDHLQSDHLPIHLVLGNVEPELAETDQTPKYLCDKANWELFQSLLNAECREHDPTSPDANVYLENIRSMILRSADKAIPKRTPGARGIHGLSSEWWNADCHEATAAKRRALRTFKKDMSEANRKAVEEATRHCQNIADNARQEHWERFVTEQVREPSDGSKVWKKVNAFRKRRQQPERPLFVNDQFTRGAKEKAEALAETFSKVSQSRHLPPEVAEMRRREETQFKAPVMDNSAPFNGDLTLGELETAIGSLGSANKAPGRDPISYHMIRRFTEPMKKVLLEFFQFCWESETVPEAWKEALVVGIPKVGKPRHLPTSYRPIALTPHLGKVYERMVKNRLEYFLEKQGILPKCQAGFRKGRNCMEHVVRLTEHVKKGLTGNRTTVATFFDIKRAFDTVWHGKLLDKLGRLGISGRMYQYVKAFLDNRRMAVKVESATSETYTLDMGVPQGSVIAPLLFIVMLHDLEDSIRRQGLHTSLYADDLAIWMRAPTKRQLSLKWRKAYQECIDDVQRYMERNGFELSAEKTVLMVFTRQTGVRSSMTIKVRDKVIEPSHEAKFLGVTLNQNLTWGPHIRNLTTKAMRGANLVKLLTKETWVTPRSLVNLTRALVRSRLMYGSEAFLNISDGQWLVLERVELAALKASLGLPRGAVNDLVYQEVGWVPLREACRMNSANFEARAHTVPNCVEEVLGENFASDGSRSHLQRRKPTVFRRTQPLRAGTKKIWDRCGISPREADPLPNHRHPPWGLEKPTFDLRYGEAHSKKADPLYLATLAKERVSTRLSHHLKIFTDGSVFEEGEIGCAFVIPDLGVTKRYKLSDGVSIFTAELYAILMACSYVNDLPNPPRAVAILSDSKSSLQALARGGTMNRSSFQQEILFLAHQIIRKGTDLTLMWLPSHTGIRGNDLADRAARAATRTGTPVETGLSVSEIKGKTRWATHREREETLRERCRAHGWLFLSGVKMHVPHLPRKNLRILCRIRTASSIYLWRNPKCDCGTGLDLQHIVGGCGSLPNDLSPVWNLRRAEQLQTEDFLKPHPSLGEGLMRILTDAIIKSGLAKWF